MKNVHSPFGGGGDFKIKEHKLANETGALTNDKLILPRHIIPPGRMRQRTRRMT